MTYKQRHIFEAECCEDWWESYHLKPYPRWIEDAWHDVTDSLMALYHYVLAYAPREEE